MHYLLEKQIICWAKVLCECQFLFPMKTRVFVWNESYAFFRCLLVCCLLALSFFDSLFVYASFLWNCFSFVYLGLGAREYNDKAKEDDGILEVYPI